jgi:hypothetical protein
MKRLFLTAILGLVTGPALWATDAFYINYSTVTTPPVIDATNFVNRGIFNFTTSGPFDFSNVRNYTNYSVMHNGSLDQAGGGLTNSSGSGGSNGLSLATGPGYRFDTAPTSSGSRFMAANFFVAPLAGNAATNARVYADYQLFVNATNIVNAGLLGVSEYGLISLQGKSVDITRGILQVGGFSTRTPLTPEALFDQHWAFGNVLSTPAAEIIAGNPRTPPYQITAFTGAPTTPYAQQQHSLFPFTIGVGPGQITSAIFTNYVGTNGVAQIVFVRNQNTNIPVQILNPNPGATRAGVLNLVWSSVGTNVFGKVVTNNVVLQDSFATNPTNTVLLVNFPFSSPPPQSVPIEPSTRQPINFTISRSLAGLVPNAQTNTPFADPSNPLAFWGPGNVTNAYSAYKVKLATTTMDSVQITNTRTGPGRVEMVADQSLDLSLTRVDGLNYMKLQGTNHFKGASNASMSVAYADVALGSTNGSLSTAGLLTPNIPRINGSLDCYSAVWVNQVPAGGQTNTVYFNVLFVDANLTGFAAPELFDLSLRAPNLTIDNTCIVHDNLSLDTSRLTLTTNAVLDVRRSDIVWSAAAPALVALTNGGSITVPGQLQFIGLNPDGSPRPYTDFVNTGSASGTFVSINSANVLNGGLIQSQAGPLLIDSSSNVVLLPNGTLSAALEAVDISCRNLLVTNHTLNVGRELSLSVTNSLLAGVNNWTVQNGFNFWVKPATSDLLGTTITDVGFAFTEVDHNWPGSDLGATVTGFTNNLALGMLVLNGSDSTKFTFIGTGGNNALYVDRLELQNGAGQFDAQGNLTQVDLNAGMKIYYAQATVNGASVAEFLNGKNGGRLQWVSSYAGTFSGTNLVYPDGTTNFLNAALVTSCNLDSDGDGIPNCVDPTPVFIPQLGLLAARLVSSPAPALALSWVTTAGATNKLYSAAAPHASSWQLVTNVLSPMSATSPFTNEVRMPLGAGGQFYRVEVAVPR